MPGTTVHVLVATSAHARVDALNVVGSATTVCKQWAEQQAEQKGKEEVKYFCKALDLAEAVPGDVAEYPVLDMLIRSDPPARLGGELWEVQGVAFVVRDHLKHGPLCVSLGLFGMHF